jgi:FtsP/CotA-like multicopper oxidase with cupredoxin domain
MGFINRTTWNPQTPPLLSLPRSEWDDHRLIPWIPLPSSPNSNANDGTDDSHNATWVDIIINNLDDGSNPFHLHGHRFYVLAAHKSEHGWGSYSPYSSAASNAVPELNLSNPLRKDTVAVPRRGYVVLRFKADNDGLWMLHCHVLVHLSSGMAMGLHVGAEEAHAVLDEDARGLCS